VSGVCMCMCMCVCVCVCVFFVCLFTTIVYYSFSYNISLITMSGFIFCFVSVG